MKGETARRHKILVHTAYIHALNAKTAQKQGSVRDREREGTERARNVNHPHSENSNRRVG